MYSNLLKHTKKTFVLLVVAVFALGALFLFTPAAFAINPPTGLNVTAGASPNINLTWAAPGGQDHYKVYRALSTITDVNKGAAKLLSDGLTTESYTDSTGIPGERYYYQVAAVDATGNESGVSTSVVSDNALVAGSENPHYNYSNLTNFCRDCHQVHLAESSVNIYRRTPSIDICYVCHDGTGGTYNIQSTYKNLAAHDTQLTNPASDIKCIYCHYPHDAPSPTRYTWLTKKSEENLCYDCHTTIQTNFAKTSHHAITGTTGDGLTGAKVECTSCHGPHTVKTTAKTSDPDNTFNLSGEVGAHTSFCIKCHDGTPPTQTWGSPTTFVPYTIAFPSVTSYPFFPGWSKSAYTSAAHYTVLTGDKRACTNCHEFHGTDYPRLLRGGEDTTSSTTGTCLYDPWGSACHVSGNSYGAPDVKTPLIKKDVAWTYTSTWNAPDVGTYAEPAFADLDNDGDYDLLIGAYDGISYAYKNTGRATSPTWTYNSAWNAPDIGSYAAPAFADLDNDGDYDLLIGESGGTCRAYKNTGSATSPTWTAEATWDTPDVGTYAVPAFAGLDNDGDYDLLIGETSGISYAYKNTGSATSPTWTAEATWNTPDVGTYAVPAFADLDNDGDYDLLIGEYAGISYAYKNTGSATSPTWTANSAWNAPDVGSDTAPALADLDNDGDPDLLIGENAGISYAYKNTGGYVGHPTLTISNAHKDTETSSDLAESNKHAECVDCHNPHNATSSNEIQGVGGVQKDGATPINPASYQYEICFKCHSNYNGGLTGHTNKADEFTGATKNAWHPVANTGKNLGIRDGAFVQGTPWNPTAGDDADYSASSEKISCSGSRNTSGAFETYGCHGNDSYSLSSDAQGPHGSGIINILIANADTSSGSASSSDVCFLCHNWDTYYNDGYGTDTTAVNTRFEHAYHIRKGYNCTEACHQSVMHGTDYYHFQRSGYIHYSDGGDLTTTTAGCSATGGCHSGVDYPRYYSNY